MRKSNLRPIAFVLASTNHGSMLVNRHDYHAVLNGGYGVGLELLQTSSFSQPEVDFALQLLESRKVHFGEDVVAIDCGANIGVHTIEWAQYMHGWGSVIAIEAQERIFYALAGNITLNNCFNARAIWAAVGASKGSIGVPVPDYFSPASFGSLEIRQTGDTEFIGQEVDYSPDKMQATQMLALDDLELKRLDLIKIDIEGMELEALSGAEKTISRTKPQLIIEKIKSDEKQLYDFLNSHGYKIFPWNQNIVGIHDSDPAAKLIQVSG